MDAANVLDVWLTVRRLDRNNRTIRKRASATTPKHTSFTIREVSAKNPPFSSATNFIVEALVFVFIAIGMLFCAGLSFKLIFGGQSIYVNFMFSTLLYCL